jgi:hypothetical protein
MNFYSFVLLTLLQSLLFTPSFSQDYFLQGHGAFDEAIPSPEAFLGYPIGSHHTRYDRIVSYFEKLAELSDRASLEVYGQTHEHRPLIMLTVTSPANLADIAKYQETHLTLCHPHSEIGDVSALPVFINLGYNVHGNEPSSAEAAMLTAYVLVASQSAVVENYRQNSVVFIDPTINPDGRDRHTHWVNMHKGSPLVADPLDIEHNEAWPRGRTNHYWFDLNRDWILGIHPESRGKLQWYHQWYPHVVTDFHEMGTNSTYFFEPMKTNGSKDPIMPRENYTTLNDMFAAYFAQALDSIGSFYFTKEVFDGTYPGYGSSYPDLQGGLGLLFEQASSRGHLQNTPTGPISFAFTIRNQFTSSLATVRAAVENKDYLHQYQHEFFRSAISNAQADKVKAYVFGDWQDPNRNRAFLDKLLLHGVEVYEIEAGLERNGRIYMPGAAWVVPTEQPQYRMVQTMFETYEEYQDSVYYDASAWSIANFYNMPYEAIENRKSISFGERVKATQLQAEVDPVNRSEYAYLIPWTDYNAPAVLNHLQAQGVVVNAAFKPLMTDVGVYEQEFGYGTLLVPVRSRQTADPEEVHRLVQEASQKCKVPAYGMESGFSVRGIDLGSGNFRTLEPPRAALLVGEGVSSYEAGEVWHLLDQRVGMPITKLDLRLWNRIDWTQYKTLVMVSGNYDQLDSVKRQTLKDWVSRGNTLITIRQATDWAIKQKLVKESLIQEEKPEAEEGEEEGVARKPYVQARELRGREQVGGAIFEVDLDLTHPLAFGYTHPKLPVYRNSTIWLAPSKNPYSTVAKYSDDPHIDGFITEKNLETFLKPSASLIVSQLGRGRVVMFADNPNFRGSWYGTNRLFLNALFLGQHISVPR